MVFWTFRAFVWSVQHAPCTSSVGAVERSFGGYADASWFEVHRQGAPRGPSRCASLVCARLRALPRVRPRRSCPRLSVLAGLLLSSWKRKKLGRSRAFLVRWSGRRDSNPRLQPWQGCTLPLSYSRTEPDDNNLLERETGFEPATSTLARLHSTTELFPHRSSVFASAVPR
jgi:hypothetical protein